MWERHESLDRVMEGGGRALGLLLVDQRLNVTCAFAFGFDAIFAYLGGGETGRRRHQQKSTLTGFSSPHLIRLFRHAEASSVPMYATCGSLAPHCIEESLT